MKSNSKVDNRNTCSSDKNYKNHSGILSLQEIVELGLIRDSAGKTITIPSFDESDPTTFVPSGSYDMHVGDKHFLFESSGHWKPVFLGSPDTLKKANKGVDEEIRLKLSEAGEDLLVIPPFCSAIIQLDEIIDLYTVAKKEQLMIAGRFDLKLSAIYKGLISQQATQVEPCYMGRLYCFVHNLGEQEVFLKKGDRFATIEFSYVGQGLNKEERNKIIKNTISSNADKYKDSTYSYREEETYTGIEDIRWLKEKRFPEQCGIAPIYNLVTGNIDDQVDKHLEKSSTIETITNKVSDLIKEKENLLRIVLSLALAIITFLATNIIIEVRTELRFFSDELAFFSDNYASLAAIVENTEVSLTEGDGNYLDISNDSTTLAEGDNGSIARTSDNISASETAIVLDNTYDSNSMQTLNTLEALKEHTREVAKTRTTFLWITVGAFSLFFIVAIVLLVMAGANFIENNWRRKNRELEAQYAYEKVKKDHEKGKTL